MRVSGNGLRSGVEKANSYGLSLGSSYLFDGLDLGSSWLAFITDCFNTARFMACSGLVYDFSISRSQLHWLLYTFLTAFLWLQPPWPLTKSWVTGLPPDFVMTSLWLLYNRPGRPLAQLLLRPCILPCICLAFYLAFAMHLPCIWPCISGKSPVLAVSGRFAGVSVKMQGQQQEQQQG